MALFNLFSDSQFKLLIQFLCDLLSTIHSHRRATEEGFAKVAEAITNKPPGLPPDSTIAIGGTILSRYRFREDQAPVSFDIVAGNMKSAAGTPVGASDIDLSVESSSAQLKAELSNQALSEDGNSVSATVTLTGQPMANTELAVVTYRAKNRDTGNDVAADTDEFETGPGEAAIGTLDSPVPLDEVGGGEVTDG